MSGASGVSAITPKVTACSSTALSTRIVDRVERLGGTAVVERLADCRLAGAFGAADTAGTGGFNEAAGTGGAAGADDASGANGAVGADGPDDVTCAAADVTTTAVLLRSAAIIVDGCPERTAAGAGGAAKAVDTL